VPGGRTTAHRELNLKRFGPDLHVVLVRFSGVPSAATVVEARLVIAHLHWGSSRQVYEGLNAAVLKTQPDSLGFATTAAAGLAKLVELDHSLLQASLMDSLDRYTAVSTGDTGDR
jgi:hypothetical protein